MKDVVLNQVKDIRFLLVYITFFVMAYLGLDSYLGDWTAISALLGSGVLSVASLATYKFLAGEKG